MGGHGRILHTGNLGGIGDTRTIDVPAVPLVSLGGPVPLQYSSSTAIVNGGARSSGRAGIAAVIGPTTFRFALAPTTSLTQSGNLNTSPATASTLQIDFWGQFLIQETPLGTGNLAGFTIPLLANVPDSRSAFTQVSTAAEFLLGGGKTCGRRSPTAACSTSATCPAATSPLDPTSPARRPIRSASTGSSPSPARSCLPSTTTTTRPRSS